MRALIRHFGLRGLGRDVCQVHCKTFWGDAFSKVASKRHFTVFHGIGSDFQIQRKTEQTVLH